jgi:hypothetical protein
MRVRKLLGWSVVLLAGLFAAIAGPVAVASAAAPQSVVADDAPGNLIWD